jgi:hypothetical protein
MCLQACCIITSPPPAHSFDCVGFEGGLAAGRRCLMRLATRQRDLDSALERQERCRGKGEYQCPCGCHCRACPQCTQKTDTNWSRDCGTLSHAKHAFLLRRLCWHDAICVGIAPSLSASCKWRLHVHIFGIFAGFGWRKSLPSVRSPATPPTFLLSRASGSPMVVDPSAHWLGSLCGFRCEGPVVAVPEG